MILTSLVLDGLHPTACRHASMRISCIPSRPAIMCTAATGRTQDCTRPQRQTIKLTLAMRESSTQDIGTMQFDQGLWVIRSGKN